MADDLKGLGKKRWMDNLSGDPQPGRRGEDVVTRYSSASDLSLEQMRALVKDAPEVPVFKDALAFNLYTAGELAEAMQLFRELIEVGHEEAKQRLYLGNAHYQRREWREAVEQWKTCQTTPGVTRDIRLKATERIDKLRRELGPAFPS